MPVRALITEEQRKPVPDNNGEEHLQVLRYARQSIANEAGATHFVGERGLTPNDVLALGSRKFIELGNTSDGFSLRLTTQVAGRNGQVVEGVEKVVPSSLAKVSIVVVAPDGYTPDADTISALCREARSMPIPELR